MGTSRVLAYGLLGLPLAFAALPIYVHLPSFYVHVTGMDLALLGAVLLAARLFDAVIDPWLGWLADRVSRARMVAVALVPFTVGFVALLNPPAGAAVPWLLGALVLTYAGYSAASVAYQAWGAGIGHGALLRTRLTAAREGFGLAGVVLAAALPALLASDPNTGIARLAWVLPPLLLLAALALFGAVRSSDAQTAPTAAPRRAVLAGVLQTLRDAPFRRLLAVFAVNGIAAALPATLFLFFVADVLQRADAGGALLALYFVAGALSLPAWVRLATRFGRARAWLAGMLLSIVAFAGAGVLGSGDLGAFAFICVASGLALGADLVLPAAIAADLGQRRDQAGACFGVWNFVAKANLALAAGLALPLLAALGYAPGSPDTAALQGAYAALPIAFKALAAAMLWRWRDHLEEPT